MPTPLASGRLARRGGSTAWVGDGVAAAPPPRVRLAQLLWRPRPAAGGHRPMREGGRRRPPGRNNAEHDATRGRSHPGRRSAFQSTPHTLVRTRCHAHSSPCVLSGAQWLRRPTSSWWLAATAAAGWPQLTLRTALNKEREIPLGRAPVAPLAEHRQPPPACLRQCKQPRR